MRRPWLEISRGSFNHNINQIKKIIGKTDMGLVVKANAYGHGLFEIATLAEEHTDISYLFTASSSEALALRAAGFTKPILILAYHDAPYRDVIEQNIEIAVYSNEQLQKLHAAACALGSPAKVHLKIDTGLSRLGINTENLFLYINNLVNYSGIELVGVFTHLADTNEPEQQFTHFQLEHFNRCLALLKKWGVIIQHQHALASGSLIEDEKYSMVRIGTSAYGYHKSTAQLDRFKKNFLTIILSRLQHSKRPL